MIAIRGNREPMSTLPTISVITPTFNQAPFIERTIRSVLDQQYPALEYIVMDGGSTDGTLDILKRYEGRLQWISEKDKGQADAINKGIIRSRGDIVAYLNSDDVYDPEALRTVGRHFASHPDVLWVTGKCMIIDAQDHEIRRCITAYKNFLLRRYSYSLLLVTNPISQPSTFWRRRVIEECGLFDRDQHFVMDYDYWLRIGKRFAPAVLDAYLAQFRVYATSKTSSSFLRSFREELEVAKKHSPSFLLHSLHWISYLAISAAYLVLNTAARVRKNS